MFGGPHSVAFPVGAPPARKANHYAGKPSCLQYQVSLGEMQVSVPLGDWTPRWEGSSRAHGSDWDGGGQRG